MNELLDLAASNLLRASGGFLLFVIIISIALTAWFQYKIFNGLERSRMQIAAEISEIRGLIGQHDMRIIHLEHEMSSVKGSMITWDVLKRIEMLLSARSASDADHTLANIIKAVK